MSHTQLRIVVGITGGIAAYKAVSVVREFVKDGHHVDVIATEAALQFVGRPTLEAISRNPVYVGLYDDVAQVRHVALGQQADVVVVAPATANTLAQIASGLAPDLLGNTILARRGPLVVAPAMHTEMWDNPSTQANIAVLRERGVIVVGPGVGQLTGSDSGAGRMSEPEEIVQAVYSVVVPSVQDLVGKRILITGGGTREPLDPVRFIGNRSSGKQAVALAERALRRGANVTFIGAHLEVAAPSGVTLQEVSTAAEMQDAVMRLRNSMDIVIMAAAVSDFRAEDVSENKLKKDVTSEHLHLTLVKNPDILVELVKTKPQSQIIMGFAAETGEPGKSVLELGQAKIARKGCDFLVLNQVGWDQGFGTERNVVTVLDSTGDILSEVSGSKLAVADKVLDTFA
ncbi:phosphopantothenoylcysteine decarboxylase/phosphopantothenate--cysteine ligase [Aurantimicrobium minutum]|uniref:bifunctional phosphopantothenoylcysteine decarboxylase/phosphopantothenate--cysteine ligase CoaBC n=1 Tax=Aurantimicrobium minutum TaxID=708131 RepID=UPI002474CC5A|nr:bifunctional phosphopantothenoylcysteine decarboxylase/phosphopantothenate--cysteine ligase CoaBC [Aurantimicrobium minutum]MDH6532983.1 phosphopantothenoylcysteine decarboxylase/phosphopantothenate--cysteine ligase [Aurantimicrobium minutum]